MNRVLRGAKKSLEEAGVEVIDWEPYKSMEILELTVGGGFFF